MFFNTAFSDSFLAPAKMATSDGGIWNFSSLTELHQRFGWEEYLVLSAVLLISVLIGKPVGPVEILGQVTKVGVSAQTTN